MIVNNISLADCWSLGKTNAIDFLSEYYDAQIINYDLNNCNYKVTMLNPKGMYNFA